jgi:hypothetical protein
VSDVRRFAALGRFLAGQSSGPHALRVGLPLYLATGIFATLIFAHSGLEAATVVRRAESAAAARFLLLAAWVVATLPVVRAILLTDENAFVRSLPVPRWQIALWLGVLMGFAELPWFVLWARGGGALSGLGAMLTALALHACWAVRVRTLLDVGLATIVCIGWLLAPSLGTITVSSAAFVLALPRAWQRAPLFRASLLRGRIVGRPAFALATVYALIAVRRHWAALLRAVFIVAIAMAWVGLAVINDRAWGSQSPLWLALSVWIPSCIFASATPLGPILRTEQAADWILAACGTTRNERRAATVGLLSTAGGTTGVLAGSLVGAWLDRGWLQRLGLAASLALAGAVLSSLTEVCVRWSMREDGRDGGRMVLALGALIALAEGALWLSPL